MNNFNFLKKELLQHLVIVILLFIVSAALFYPELSGKEIQAGDIVSSVAKTKHITDYREAKHELSYWNPAQFSGGPIYLLNLGQESNLLGSFQKLFSLNNFGAIGMFFALGLSMYLSLVILRVKPWLSFVLSLAFMFNLVFFTLLEAGHFKKIDTLGYLPLIVSGLIVLLRNEYIKGSIALLLGTSLAIYTGHVQMVFYLILALFGLGIPLFIFALIRKELSTFLPGLGLAILIAVLAAGTNYAQLNSSYKFSSKTMRGGGVLAKEEANDIEDSKGLSWQYAMNWSYETEDFLNILIPRIVGGGSQEMVDKENPIAQLMLQNSAQLVKGKVAIPGYWSTMPFTSGGAYLGASVLLLFVFSLFLMKREHAVAFGTAFIVVFLLSLGENATWFNKLLFNNLPLFDKFRAPSSAISILAGFIVLAVGMGLQAFLDNKEDKKLTKSLLWSMGLLSALVLLILAYGLGSFSFLSANDSNYPYNIQQILIDGRKEIFQADALRSLGFILATGLVIFLYIKNKISSKPVFYTVLGFLFLIDLVPIARRYVNEDSFVSENQYMQQFAPRQSDLEISKMETKGRGFYRVLDLSVNTFNDAKPSYHHNQIGGYDPAKLQRYQDIISYHISNNNFEVLNMLNAKYIVGQNGKVQVNPASNGNAWFVKELIYVNSDQEEIDKLSDFNSKSSAIILAEEFGNQFSTNQGDGSISLTEYEPNRLVYKSQASNKGLAVFSEVWYGGNPDWKAWIDGEEVSIIRANYVLRALEIPAGSHDIVMEFKPKAAGSYYSLISSILGLLIILGGIAYQLKDKLKNQDATNVKA
ncbi:MAG: hypothetical protein R2772_03445 [Chitinophagales bacterium]